MLGISISVVLGSLIAIAWIALTILLCVWVYRDAQRKGMNGILWTALVLLVPSYIGLIIYLVVRSDNNKVICSNCDKPVNGRNKFCSNCGMELVPAADGMNDENFKQSQKKILIGLFSTLAAIVIFSIFMVASLIIGSMKLVGDAVGWLSKISAIEWDNTLEEALGDLDVLFNEDEIHVSITDETVTITDKEGNELFNVDGTNETVDVNVQELRNLFDQYGVSYDADMNEKELEKYIQQKISDAIDEALKNDEAEK